MVATAKSGEPFGFDCEWGAGWCTVTLGSGEKGWIPLDQVRLYYSDADLPSTAPDPAGPSEIDEVARRRGFGYAAVTRRAAHGDTKALKQFFGLARHVDGAAAESYYGMPTAVYHLVGDERFAAFLSAQTVDFQGFIRNLIVGDCPLPPATDYLRRHFPTTTRLLFNREMVGWSSPNGRYAIRKVFDDEFDIVSSRVVRAELILKATGAVLCDLTSADIGTGLDREGTVLWSPDSRRFAYHSSDMAHVGSGLFTRQDSTPQIQQTVVFQIAGASAAPINLNLNTVPGREADTELHGAILGHEFTTPTAWKTATLLVLDRHEYYEKKVPMTVGGSTFHSIINLSRQYRIQATFRPEGTAQVAWRLRKY